MSVCGHSSSFFGFLRTVLPGLLDCMPARRLDKGMAGGSTVQNRPNIDPQLLATSSHIDDAAGFRPPFRVTFAARQRHDPGAGAPTGHARFRGQRHAAERFYDGHPVGFLCEIAAGWLLFRAELEPSYFRRRGQHGLFLGPLSG